MDAYGITRLRQSQTESWGVCVFRDFEVFAVRFFGQRLAWYSGNAERHIVFHGSKQD